MKTTIAKSKKSTIVQKAIAGILTSSIALFSAMPVYAGTTVDQETLYPILRNSTTQYLYPVTGTTKTIYRLTNIADILAQFADQSTLNQKSIYTLMNTIGGYVDGIEGYVDGIEGYVDGIEGQITTSNTHLNAIKGYVDTLETLVTTSNTHLNAIKGYVDGIEGKIDTSNTRLNDIKSAIQNITTYDYSQVLSDILTNTGYLSTIDTYTQSIQDSIGYGTTGDNIQSKLSGISTYTATTNTKLDTIIGKFTNKRVAWSYINKSYPGSTAISAISKQTPRYFAWSVSDRGDGVSIPRLGISADGNSTIDSPMDYLAFMNNNLLTITSLIRGVSTEYSVQLYDMDGTIESNVRKPTSISDYYNIYYPQFDKVLKRLGYVLADDDTISAKNANQAQEQAVLTNFTGQGNSSASASDFGELSSAVSSVKSGLNTNASPSDVLTVFNSNDGFGWFSQATLDELDTTTQNTRTMKGGSNTPLYDSNYNAIMEYLTGGEKK